MSPVIRYIVAFAWGFVLLLSFAGWGLIVGHLLRDELKDDWGQAIAQGDLPDGDRRGGGSTFSTSFRMPWFWGWS